MNTLTRTMWNTLFLCFLTQLLLCSADVSRANRIKRFAGFNLAGIGGTTGCVTTGGKLFINGLFERTLSPDEVIELETYQTEHQKYREELKVWLNETKGGLRVAHAHGINGKDSPVTIDNNLPKPPKKPSFCQLNNVTQYYFDGCMVQNNKVYVGTVFARDLKDEEIKELEEFDRKMTKYQATTLLQKTKSLFGGKSSIWDLLYMDTFKQTEASTMAPSVESIELHEPPTAPNFCIVIY